MKSSKLVITNIIAPSILSGLQYFIMFLMVRAGSSLTDEAEQTSHVVGRLMSNGNADSQEFCKLLSLTKSRNLIVKNVFFEINWNVLLAVNCTFDINSII